MRTNDSLGERTAGALPAIVRQANNTKNVDAFFADYTVIIGLSHHSKIEHLLLLSLFLAEGKA